MRQTPQQAAEEAMRLTSAPPGDGDRVAGYGVMGVPFARGDYLALRHWPASSFGPGYRSVWHRDPAGRWTIHSDAAPEVSCARFLGTAVDRTRTVPIHITWSSPHHLRVRVVPDLEWSLELAASLPSRVLSRLGPSLPQSVWAGDGLLRLLGSTTAPLLGVGRMRLCGAVPNGQHFQVAPRRLWVVRRSTARISGQELGTQQPLDEQAHLADFWLPQRGIFYAATTASFTGSGSQHQPAVTMG